MYVSVPVHYLFLLVSNNSLKQKKIEIVFDLFLVAEIGLEPMTFGL